MGPTRARARRLGARLGAEQLLCLVAADPRHEAEATRKVRMLGELEHRPGGTVDVIRARVDECLDVAFKEGPDAHRARLEGREDRRLGETGGAEPPGGLAKGDDDGVRRRVVGLVQTIVCAGDHRVVHDGDGGDRTLAAGERHARFGERFAHEQLVVHRADDTGGVRRAGRRPAPWRLGPASPSASLGPVPAGRGGARTMALAFNDETGRVPVDVLGSGEIGAR